MFGFIKKEEFPNIDWYCDNCNDYLNSQSGFYDGCGNWTCTNCGHINPLLKMKSFGMMIQVMMISMISYQI